MRSKPTVRKQLHYSDISISFLNVCGLQSKLLFPEFELYLNTHDIIGAAETITFGDDMILFPNYSYFSKHRKYYIRRSGGLGIFVKENILPFIDVIDIDSEFLMLLKISHVLTAKDQDSFIAFVYLPPEGSDYSNNDSMSEIESVLLPYIENCKYFYIKGDLNARTSNSAEYLEIEVDSLSTEQYGIDDDVISYMNNVQELQNHKLSLLRQSKDKIRNNYGNKLLQLCCNNNLYICNGRLNGDLTGAYTCTKGSVIDYLIANIDGLLSVNNFMIHDFSPLCSDVHCAISFVIKAFVITCKNNKIVHKYKRWEPSKRESFINNICRNKISELNLMLENSRDCPLDKSKIDDFASKINDIFQQSAKKSFKSYSVLSKKS